MLEHDYCNNYTNAALGLVTPQVRWICRSRSGHAWPIRDLEDQIHCPTPQILLTPASCEDMAFSEEAILDKLNEWKWTNIQTPIQYILVFYMKLDINCNPFTYDIWNFLQYKFNLSELEIC